MKLTIGARRDSDGQIVSTIIQDEVEVFASRNPFEVQDRFRELKAQPQQRRARERAAPQPHAQKATAASVLAGVVRVYIGVETCDASIDYARAIYREVTGRDLDETRTREQGYYRYPAGPRNANPDHERVFGARVEWRVRCYGADGAITEYNCRDLALEFLRSGFDIGYTTVVFSDS